MRMPIPDDWDSESVCHYVVEWPDSPQWLAILKGELYSPSRENYWDKSTGDVAAVVEAFEPTTDFNLDKLECNNMTYVGMIVLWPGTAFPDGWIECDGLLLDDTDFPDLFAVIGTDYGSSGAGTYRIPDLRGRVPVGNDNGQAEFAAMGQSGGFKAHTLTMTEIPSHNHSYNTPDSGTPQYATVQSGTGVQLRRVASMSGNAGGGAAHNNLQPYLTFKYIIRAR